MPDVTPAAVIAFAESAPGPPVPRTRAAGSRGTARDRLRDPAAIAAALTLAAIALAAVFAPFLAPYDPAQTLDVVSRAQPPSAAHLLGTDPLSRDLLSRLLHGARVSLGISMVAVAVATLVGTAWGAVAGYFGGAADRILMSLVDAGLAIPRILLLLGVVAFWGTLSVTAIVLLLGLTGWFGSSRLVRAAVLSTRDRDFSVAARALGAAPLRVLVRHVLPHALAPMLVAATLGVGQVIVLEAGLSFLGYGVAPPTASWGSLIRDGREVLATAWWVSVFPGAALAATTLAINVLGDRLRGALGARQLPAP